jgi:membrane fusion protein (multidrug efflux system)
LCAGKLFFRDLATTRKSANYDSIVASASNPSHHFRKTRMHNIKHVDCGSRSPGHSRAVRSPCAARALILALLNLTPASVLAQGAPSAPPAVGVAKVEKTPIKESEKFNGRIQAVRRVDIAARVTAFLDQVLFKDGAEVKQGDVLYRLERAPFDADFEAKKAVAEQVRAQLQNADLALERARSLLKTQAGTQATVDTAIATQRGFAAQLQGAEANIKQSQISLGYTVIASPIAGKIGRTAITPGNVVSPGSGVLTNIVSQDPMYVTFPISVRAYSELRARYSDLAADVILHLTLPDGKPYAEAGRLDFVDNTIQSGTDTILLRGVIPNPRRTENGDNVGASRQLVDNEFVTVKVEGSQPVLALTAPRSAILVDQRGPYVFVVGQDNIARRQDIKLGQSTPTVASILEGLKEGDTIVVEGLQRVRPGRPVSPGEAVAPKLPASPASEGR